MTAPLDVIAFPGGTNLPLWAGMEQGTFERHGVTVRLHLTRGSVEQLSGLARGEWDIGLTAFDNVVAYREGQGEVPIEGPVDLFAFMGCDDAFLRLVVQGDIETYDDLRGRQLSVDAMTTGFAFVLQAMIEKAGLTGAVEFVSVGGVQQRWEALKEGEHAGTLLLTPFEFIAEQVGLRTLQSANEVFPRYQGVVGAARQSWASAHQEHLVAFISGYLEALDWLFDAGNRDAACDLLVRNLPNMTAQLAKRCCDIFLAPEGGFMRNAEIDFAGADTVLSLRSRYGPNGSALGGGKAYCDLTYLNQARGLV